MNILVKNNISVELCFIDEGHLFTDSENSLYLKCSNKIETNEIGLSGFKCTRIGDGVTQVFSPKTLVFRVKNVIVEF